LLARARYNNVAESPDEISFRQGDIVTVLQKDYKGQVDWWLCELRGEVGMVPANYFEIFHDHDVTTYDFPRSARSTPIPPSFSQEEQSGPIYDTPPPPGPADGEENDHDYALPPPSDELYDRPPSSTRSSMKSSNRISAASSVNSSSTYDVPPDLADVYDIPRPSGAAKGFEEEEKQPPLQAVDISKMYDDQAEELLTSYRQLISATYENLVQSVYGPDAYWGMDNKPKRTNTLQRATTATKHFDRALTALLEFGKGVSNMLECSSDTNFRKRYNSAFRGLLQNRHDILTKLDSLSSENETITATVKSLLEVARTVPSAVTEFTVLVQANKLLLFKSSSKNSNSLPVITKNEVKSRPLPELPVPPQSTQDFNTDYADPDSQAEFQKPPSGRGTPDRLLEETSLDWGGTYSRRRKPNDQLPPTPPSYATVPRQPKSKQKDPLHTPVRSRSPYGTRPAYESQKTPKRNVVNGNYNDIDGVIDPRLIGRRPSPASPAGSRGPSPQPMKLRQESLSSCSGSSEDIGHTPMKRSRSVDLLDGPYGRANGYNTNNRSSSPKPLRQEDRELLERFSKQMDLIVPSLRDSIGVLLDCLKDSEPPRDFVTKSKLAVVAAYKLVYVADALTQKILHTDTKAEILASSNQLTESIKVLVTDTKTAALQYPSVIALNRMAESLRKVFPSALDLVNSVKTHSTFV